MDLTPSSGTGRFCKINSFSVGPVIKSSDLAIAWAVIG
jgi:hypothetical protein